MVKQDQNLSQSSNQEYKQSPPAPQRLPQEKVIENQKNEEEQDFTQCADYKQKDNKINERQHSAFQSFDRNEGEGHSQKS